MSTQSGLDKSMFNRIFRNTLEIHAEMLELMIINDNNNSAPSLFWLLHEIIDDCFADCFD